MYLCSVVNDLVSASCNSVGFISKRYFFFTFSGVTHVGSEAEKQELSSGGYAYTTSCLVKGIRNNFTIFFKICLLSIYVVNLNIFLAVFYKLLAARFEYSFSKVLFLDDYVR